MSHIDLNELDVETQNLLVPLPTGEEVRQKHLQQHLQQLPIRFYSLLHN